MLREQHGLQMCKVYLKFRGGRVVAVNSTGSWRCVGSRILTSVSARPTFQSLAVQRTAGENLKQIPALFSV